MTQTHPRDGSAIAHLRRASVYLALAALLAFVVAAAAKVMQGQTAPRTTPSEIRFGISIANPTGENSDSVKAILRRDLDFSDRVRVVPIETVSGNFAFDASSSADYARLGKLGTSYVLSAGVNGGKLSVTLFDVRARKIARTKEFLLSGSAADNPTPARLASNRPGLSPEFRATLHEATDDILEWITGQRGIAATRVVYVAGGKVRVVDSDGANDHAVTSAGDALSPAWNPNGRSIVYSDFGDAGTQIAEVDLESGKTRLLNATPRGLNITPVFTPDGQNVVYASGGEQPADLVMASASNPRQAKKLGAGSLTEQSSPTLSPDGRRVAFIAPAPKTPQIFTMNIDGTDIQQLTPSVPGVRSYRTSPDWSPDGKTIAFEQQNGDFQVWTISLADRKMTKVTSIGENEDPSWAPDARHVVLTSTRHGSKNLWVLDTRSGRMRQLTFNDGARLAAWSPLLSTSTVLTASAAAISSGSNQQQ